MMQWQIFVGIIGLLLGCGRTTLDYGSQRKLPEDRGVRKSVEEVLFLEPGGYGVSGVLNYSIYQDGSIRYEGTVTYLIDRLLSLDLYGVEHTSSLSGAFKISQNRILSEVYKNPGVSYIEKKVSVKVLSYDEQSEIATVQLTIAPQFRETNGEIHDKDYLGWSVRRATDDHNAIVNMTLDTSSKYIRIISFLANGRVWGTSVTIEGSDKNPY